jgi:hypothetical protein
MRAVDFLGRATLAGDLTADGLENDLLGRDGFDWGFDGWGSARRMEAPEFGSGFDTGERQRS